MLKRWRVFPRMIQIAMPLLTHPTSPDPQMDRIHHSHQPHRRLHRSSRHSPSLQPRDEDFQKVQDHRSVRAPVRVRVFQTKNNTFTGVFADLEQSHPDLHRTSHPPIARAQKRHVQFRLRTRGSPHASSDVLQRPRRHLALPVHVPRISTHRPLRARRHRHNG